MYVRTDAKTFNFITNKVQAIHMLKKNPRKVPWTQVYRKLHKKDATSDLEKKARQRRVQKAQRAYVNLSLEQLRAKKAAKDVAKPAVAKDVKAKAAKAKAAKSTKATGSLKLQALKSQKPVVSHQKAPKAGAGGKGGR